MFIVHVICITAGVLTVVPFLYVLSGSFATEKELLERSFFIIPHTISTNAYKYIVADGSIFSGGNAIEAAVSLEAAGADAVGVNCSVGPDQLVSVIRNIKENVSIPVIAKPNAGMPFIDDNGNAVYSMKAPDFARHVKALIDAGAGIVGGCCGTTPEYIREVAKMIGR